MPNLDAAIDWAIARDRWSDAAELLADPDAKWFYLPLSRSKLDRLDLVSAALPDTSPLSERLRIAEIQFATAVSDEQRALTAARQATEASDESVRFAGLLWTAQMSMLADPDESMRLADAAEATGHVDEIGQVDGIRAYVHMLAGEYQQALALLSPNPDVGVTRDAAIAALLLMDGQASAALAMADHHPLAESSWNAFSVIVGLSELALGRHEDAERDLVAGARRAASGRIPLASNTALIGLAALVNLNGDADWATEIILGAALQRLIAMDALARFVAEQIAVRDGFVQRQEATPLLGQAAGATVFLRETLARWDAQHAAPRTR
jgi:hypothetical protein